MKVRARKWQQPETERLVDGEPMSFAPDEYVNLFEMKAGDVVFVEIEASGFGSRDGWSLWRVEVVEASQHVRMNTTGPVSYEDAELELRRISA